MDWAEPRFCRGWWAATLGAICAVTVIFIPTFFGTPLPLSNINLGARRDWRHAVAAQIGVCTGRLLRMYY